MKSVVWALLAAVLAGALGFYGGVTYQKTQTQASFASRFGAGGQGGLARGQGGTNGGRFGGNIATGTVIAQSADSITVKQASGGSKTVFVSSSTEVSKQQQLSISDVKVGDQVAAVGQQANGGIDARLIQIVPPGGSFRFGGLFGGAPNGGPQGGAPQGAPSGQ